MRMRKPIWSNGSPGQEITPGLSSADGTNAGFCLAAKTKHSPISWLKCMIFSYMCTCIGAIYVSVHVDNQCTCIYQLLVGCLRF